MQLTARMTLLFALAAAAAWPSQMILCQERDGSIGFESRMDDCCTRAPVPDGERETSCEGCRDFEPSASSRAQHADPAQAPAALLVGVDFRNESPFAANPMAASGDAMSGRARSVAPCLAATILLL